MTERSPEFSLKSLSKDKENSAHTEENFTFGDTIAFGCAKPQEHTDGEMIL